MNKKIKGIGYLAKLVRFRTLTDPCNTRSPIKKITIKELKYIATLAIQIYSISLHKNIQFEIYQSVPYQHREKFLWPMEFFLRNSSSDVLKFFLTRRN